MKKIVDNYFKRIIILFLNVLIKKSLYLYIPVNGKNWSCSDYFNFMQYSNLFSLLILLLMTSFFSC